MQDNSCLFLDFLKKMTLERGKLPQDKVITLKLLSHLKHCVLAPILFMLWVVRGDDPHLIKYFFFISLFFCLLTVSLSTLSPTLQGFSELADRQCLRPLEVFCTKGRLFFLS